MYRKQLPLFLWALRLGYQKICGAQINMADLMQVSCESSASIFRQIVGWYE